MATCLMAYVGTNTAAKLAIFTITRRCYPAVMITT